MFIIVHDGQYFMRRCRPPAGDGEHLWIIHRHGAVLHGAVQAPLGRRGTLLKWCRPTVGDREHYWIITRGRAVLHGAGHAPCGWRGNFVHHCSWWAVLYAAVQAHRGERGTFVNHSLSWCSTSWMGAGPQWGMGNIIKSLLWDWQYFMGRCRLRDLIKILEQ